MFAHHFLPERLLLPVITATFSRHSYPPPASLTSDVSTPAMCNPDLSLQQSAALSLLPVTFFRRFVPAPPSPSPLQKTFLVAPGLASDASTPAMTDPNLSLQQSAALLAAAPLENEPGAVFRYSNTAMQVAGAVVEEVTGECWHEVSVCVGGRGPGGGVRG
jgi:hypothetical protein